MELGTFYPVVSADDAYAEIDNNITMGDFSNGYSYYTYGYDSGMDWDVHFACRFLSVNIPKGATITGCFMRAYAGYSLSTEANFVLHCKALDDGTQPDENVSWWTTNLTTGTDWLTAAAQIAATQYDTPDFISELQAIVDRNGWSSGNAVTVLIKNKTLGTGGNRSGYFINYSGGTRKAELHVTWTEPVVPQEYNEEVDENIDFYDMSFNDNDAQLGPVINDELGLTDDPSYTLEMVQSIIDEFLSLMDYQELIWTFSDHSEFDDDVIDGLSSVDNPVCYLGITSSIDESLDLIDSQDIVWLKSILETFDLSDGTVTGWFKELIETLFIYDAIKHGWRVTAGSSLILADSIQTILGIIVDEWINFIDIQSNNWNGREIISEDVTLYDIARAAKIYADSLSDTVNIADVSTYGLTITVLEYLGFTELANAMRTSVMVVSDSINVTDNPMLALPLSVESILSVVDLSTLAVQFLSSVQSDLSLTDVSSLIKRISNTVTDPIVFVDTITSHAHLYSLIYDTLALNVIVELDGEVWECYTLNTPKFHPSMYSGFDFNSYCVFNNRAFGANDTGIYELTGDNDVGDVIHTGVILSQTDFGSPNQKRFRRGYLGITGDNPVMVFECEDGRREVYDIDTEGKVVASSELKSKKWVLSIAEFDTLDHLKLIPIILTK